MTKHSQPAARPAPVKVPADPEARRALLEAICASGAVKPRAGDSAARSQDFLYGADGLPQ